MACQGWSQSVWAGMRRALAPHQAEDDHGIDHFPVAQQSAPQVPLAHMQPRGPQGSGGSAVATWQTVSQVQIQVSSGMVPRSA